MPLDLNKLAKDLEALAEVHEAKKPATADRLLRAARQLTKAALELEA